MSNCRIFTRDEIETRIADGDTLIISQGDVLRLNKWQDVHPGGRFVIQHMVGRDASDELAISHNLEVLKRMKGYRIGRVEGEWENFVPPIQGGTFRRHTEKPETNDDATDATPAVKPDWTGAVAGQAMPGWKLEPVPGSYAETAINEARDADLARYPSLDAETQRNITLKFRALHQRVHDEGYYDLRPMEYGKEMVRYTTLFALLVFCLYKKWWVASGFALGIWWQQIMFTAHDAGHGGVTHNYVLDSLIAIFIGNFCCGLSIGWWKSSHNVHHFVTNDPVHDPDTQNIPMFSISPAFFSSVKSSYYNGFQFVWDHVADFTVQYQKYTYYPIMMIARFNLYYLSWLHLASRRSVKRGSAAWIRRTEIAAILCYIYIFFYRLVGCYIPTWQSRVVFLLVSHAATLPLQIQITLSHWGASTSDLGPKEVFAQRQMRTTVDVACPEWLDFFHGGLQFQTVHHLFPRVPRHNLRKLQTLVVQFCAETGIDYQMLGFVDGNRHVLGKLQHITDQAKILAACQKHMAETEGFSLPKLAEL